MDKKQHIYFASFFMVFFIIFLVAVRTNKPRILIIHSYATDFIWVKEINEGFEKAFMNRPYSVKYHYMDTKRNPDPDFIERAGTLARRIIDRWKPAVIITVDDNAQEYVGRHYLNHPEISIVFAGVNGYPEDYDYHTASNVTGILERVPFESFKEVFMKILPPENWKLLHLSDSSSSSILLARELSSYSWEPLQLVRSVKTDDFEEWKSTIMEAENVADVLLISHYHTIRSESGKRRVMPPDKVIEWTEQHTGLPNVGCWSFFLHDGGMMSIAISGQEQGEESARMAIEIIESGKKASEIPVTQTKYYFICLNEKELLSRNVNVPEVYEMFARATGHYLK